ncbi:MAG: hypothetical protein WCO35_03030 [Candidatus Nomurabacteria bacterium]
MKINFLRVLLFLSIILYSCFISFALQIKNVNYSASNNNDRWIEIYNDGPNISDFTISDYKILDSKDTIKHGINTMQGDISFLSGSTIFISPSVNIPSGATKVFKSTYILDKTSGYISIINSDNSGTYNCFSYGSVPCPNSNSIAGQDNSTSTNNVSTSTEQNISTSTSDILNSNSIVYMYVPVNNQNKYGDIQVLLPEEKTVPAGADVEYNVKVIDSHKNVLTGLDFDWSFGDGGERDSKTVIYHYVYPGEYTLIASADGYNGGAQARMKVLVINPDISISKVGIGGNENYIDLKNNTDYDLFLSNFYLNIDNNFYKLPKNFLIAKNKTVHISGEALNFKLPAVNISLNYPNKTILTSYTLNILATSSVSDLNSSSTNKDQIVVQDENVKKNNISNITDPKFTEINSLEKTNKTVPHKINTDISIKDNKDSLILKRLILNGSMDTINKKESENVKPNVKNNESVDIGIIKWFKSLLY